nr:MAG TPA: hypothetical protein [Caudoviricetes sp.]
MLSHEFRLYHAPVISYWYPFFSDALASYSTHFLYITRVLSIVVRLTTLIEE